VVIDRPPKPATSHGKITTPNELTDQRLPVLSSLRLADAENRQTRVVQRLSLVVRLAGKYIGNMRRAEALSGFAHTSMDPHRLGCAVDEMNRIEANIAIATWRRLLAEVEKKFCRRHSGRLAIGHECVKPLVFAAAALVAAILLVDEAAAHLNVAEAIDHFDIGRIAVTPCPADLLIIGVERRWQVGMEDKPHVRLVDPHAKGDGGADDDALLVMNRLCASLRSSGLMPA